MRPDAGAQARRGVVFRGLLLVSLVVGIAGLRRAARVRVQRRAGRGSQPAVAEVPVVDPELAGARSAVFGTLWVIGSPRSSRSRSGSAPRCTSRSSPTRDRWYNRLIELNIQNLAAVPSIVYGILGLAFIARGPLDLGPVVLTGGLILSLLVLPIVIIASREAIRAVPPSIRQGSLALGATQLQTVRRQVLPAAIPGIATGVILALSRAIGEAAPLLIIGAFTFVAFNPTVSTAGSRSCRSRSSTGSAGRRRGSPRSRPPRACSCC